LIYIPFFIFSFIERSTIKTFRASRFENSKDRRKGLQKIQEATGVKAYEEKDGF